MLRLESLKCNSEFLNIDAAGTAQQLTANAKFDLNRLATQLGQFVDLSGIELAGTGTAHVDWQQTDGDQFTAAANSELVAAARGARRRQGATPSRDWRSRPRPTARSIQQTHKPLRVATARAQIDAEGDQLDAQLTEAVDCTAATRRGRSRCG